MSSRAVSLMAVGALVVTFAVAAGLLTDSPRLTAHQPKPPIIETGFGFAPCSQTSEIAMDGCAGNDLIRRDRLINRQVAFLFSLHLGRKIDTEISQSQDAWLRWRDRYCHVVSTWYAGGSILPLVSAACLTQLDVVDSQNLWSLYTWIFQGDAQRSAWP